MQQKIGKYTIIKDQVIILVIILAPNNSSAEATTNDFVDLVSNGFKIKLRSATYSASGVTYIYMAFAENPLVGTNGVPATAR
jgi:hypothetical protein